MGPPAQVAAVDGPGEARSGEAEEERREAAKRRRRGAKRRSGEPEERKWRADFFAARKYAVARFLPGPLSSEAQNISLA